MKTQQERDAGRALNYIEETAKILECHHLARGTPIIGLRLSVSNAKQLQNLEKTLTGLSAEFENYESRISGRNCRVELDVKKSETEYSICPRIPIGIDSSEGAKLYAEVWQRILSRLRHFFKTPYK